ncbi:MAG TPA: molybdopterin-dependent oxidoreductase, partial [Phenylobacterium sp.]|nr:molybdopterin-dependent oxidoreductase [Phenylobacterium sp.]
GYRVVVSAAESDKELHQGGIILADTLNGAPLPDAQGPWRLVVDGDLRPWRSVRQVVSIDYRLAD